MGLRAHLAPDPGQALGSSGLAAQVGAKGHSSGAAHHRHAAGARHSHRKAKPSRGSAQQVLVGNAYDVGYGIVQVKVDRARAPDRRRDGPLPAAGRPVQRHQLATPRRSSVTRRSAPRVRTSTRCRGRRTPPPAMPSRCSRRSTSSADDPAGPCRPRSKARRHHPHDGDDRLGRPAGTGRGRDRRRRRRRRGPAGRDRRGVQPLAARLLGQPAHRRPGGAGGLPGRRAARRAAVAGAHGAHRRVLLAVLARCRACRAGSDRAGEGLGGSAGQRRAAGPRPPGPRRQRGR